MPSTVILEGDFKRIRIENNGRYCMVKTTLEIKDPNHPCYRNNPIGRRDLWIEKNKQFILNLSNKNIDKRHYQMRISVDNDLDVYSYYFTSNKTLQIWIYNQVD